jgi:hypothetical protein
VSSVPSEPDTSVSHREGPMVPCQAARSRIFQPSFEGRQPDGRGSSPREGLA